MVLQNTLSDPFLTKNDVNCLRRRQWGETSFRLEVEEIFRIERWKSSKTLWGYSISMISWKSSWKWKGKQSESSWSIDHRLLKREEVEYPYWSVRYQVLRVKYAFFACQQQRRLISQQKTWTKRRLHKSVAVTYVNIWETARDTIVALPIRKAVMVDTEFVQITVINVTYSLDVIFSCAIRQRKTRYRAQDVALLAPMDSSNRKNKTALKGCEHTSI